MPTTTFAILGDVHGFMNPMVALLEKMQRKLGCALDFALQVGDFEPHRDEDDLRSMSAPSKYKQLGDYAEYHSGRRRFPCPIYFIGGNHEPHAWLEQHPEGFALSPRCHYMGRAASMHFDDIDLRVAGLSGIYDEAVFHTPRPSIQQLEHVSNKEFITFREGDVDALLDTPPPDILLLHDWPEGTDLAITRNGQPPGNPYAKALIDLLEPRLVACGHMHTRHMHQFQHDSGRVTDLICLGHIHHRLEAIAVYSWDGQTLVQLDT